MAIRKLIFSLILLCSFNNLFSSIDDYFKRPVAPTSSNYGITGILETPNARFLREGSLRFTFSSSFPNEFTSLTASPFNWFEANYRYTERKNLLYGPSSYSGNQTLKDKAFDLKIKLINEGYILPNLALGLRDFAGTSQLASEYIVASKLIGPLDLTIGMGWGLLGNEANYSNPFTSLHGSFQNRDGGGSTEGGDLNVNNWFSGNTAIFGGIEYDLKKYGLKLKLEYDTSNPDDQTRANVPVKSRFNLGLNYYLSDSLNFGLAVERGNQLRLSFALKGVFFKDTITKIPPKNVIKLNEEQIRRSKLNKSIFFSSLNKSLRSEGLLIQGADYQEEAVNVAISTKRFSSSTRMAGRAARITSALSSDEVEKINIHTMNGDLEVSVVSLDKRKFDLGNNNNITVAEVLSESSFNSESDTPLYKRSEFKPRVNFPEYTWSMTPALRHQIGGPEAFYLGQLWWKSDLTIKFKRGLSLYSTIGVDLYNNFDELNNPSGSQIPHVRSDIQDYLREGQNNIERFRLEYMFSPHNDIFIRADIGMLEAMFGGVGGEVYYRPFNKNFSFSLSAHNVKQREYRQRFGFKKYKTTTGHLGFYYDFPKGISSSLLVGKYLAKDRGATLDIARRFKSGFTLGVFATLTDLSAEEFGEGSFDKGFYFSIPTKLFYTDYQTGNISFGLHPLTKDGGAILSLNNSLHSILGDSSKYSLERDKGDLFN